MFFGYDDGRTGGQVARQVARWRIARAMRRAYRLGGVDTWVDLGGGGRVQVVALSWGWVLWCWCGPLCLRYAVRRGSVRSMLLDLEAIG